MLPKVFTREQALGVFGVLAERHFNVTLSYSYMDKAIPPEIYTLIVPVIGHLPLTEVRDLMELADQCGCNVHLIDGGLRLEPHPEPAP
jgi:hypothetical protein